MNAIVSATNFTTAPATVDPWLSLIERVSKDPAVDVAKLERMLELRAQEQARLAAQQYREAMSACQADMEPIRTDAVNTHANNAKYATLAAVDAVARPIYTAHGFALSFDTEDCAKENHVRVVCRVHHTGGHAETFRLEMPCDGKGAKGNSIMTTTHALASAVSYARRYLLSMVFNLMVEKDDDGNAAGGRAAPQPPRPTQGRHVDGTDNRFYREPPHGPPADKPDANPVTQDFLTLRDQLRRVRSEQELTAWAASNKARIDRQPDGQKAALRDFFKMKLAGFRQPQAAE